MQIRTGFELIYSFPQPTPIILVVNIHDSRAADIVVPDRLVTEPSIPITGYRDAFGNRCNRVLAPAGRLRLSADCVISDSGQPDEMVFAAGQDSVEDLPEEILVFLLGSRYCETDMLSETAWQLFSGVAPGYPRVQAICDYVHNHIAFNYQNARATRSAAGGFQRTDRRLPRLRASCDRLLPLHEYSGAILHRLLERSGNAATLRRWAISRRGSRPGSAADGICSTRATMCLASAAF